MTRTSVWLCVAAYFLALALAQRHPRWARVWWTVGCFACLVHIALAMHLVHHWSHTAAYADTARQTREATGLDWGGGIYFNYIFAALWLVDVVWWWVGSQARARRPKWLSAALHLFLAFIIFNATVVFESGILRWSVLAAIACLAVWWFRNRRYDARVAIDPRPTGL